jgi:hypothetical protein
VYPDLGLHDAIVLEVNIVGQFLYVEVVHGVGLLLWLRLRVVVLLGPLGVVHLSCRRNIPDILFK